MALTPNQLRAECEAHTAAINTFGISPKELDAAAIRFEEAISSSPAACAILAAQQQEALEEQQRQLFEGSLTYDESISA